MKVHLALYYISFKNPSFFGKIFFYKMRVARYKLQVFRKEEERWDCRVTTFLAMTKGWIPACAGMTEGKTGMTEGEAGIKKKNVHQDYGIAALSTKAMTENVSPSPFPSPSRGEGICFFYSLFLRISNLLKVLNIYLTI